MRAERLLLFLGLVVASGAGAQGYGGLDQGAEGYAEVRREYRMDFPRDHGAHPDFRIEWWYVTANLETSDGMPLGLQWTLFRNALTPVPDEGGWQGRQMWMGHAAVTTETSHHFAERFARGGIGQAGAEASPPEIWLDDWSLAGPDFSDLGLRARAADFDYTLRLRATGPLVLNGDAGFSVKSEAGQASHYYAQPHFEVTGEVRIGAARHEVTGRAWLDREWSSQPLARGQTGWDWFALHLDGGAKLMVYALRAETGPPYVTGTWVAPDGASRPIPVGAVRLTPLNGRGDDVVTRWRIEWPEEALDVEASALNPDSWLAATYAYWEGPVTVTGSHGGVGYLEMTGRSYPGAGSRE